MREKCPGGIVMKRLLGLLVVMGLIVVVVGCGGDSNSPTGSSEEITKWKKTFGKGWGFSVQQTLDGGFILTGFLDVGGQLLLKTDAQRNEEWAKTYGHGEGYSVQQTVDGGFTVTGEDTIEDVFLLKTDGQGKTKNLDE